MESEGADITNLFVGRSELSCPVACKPSTRPPGADTCGQGGRRQDGEGSGCPGILKAFRCRFTLRLGMAEARLRWLRVHQRSLSPPSSALSKGTNCLKGLMEDGSGLPYGRRQWVKLPGEIVWRLARRQARVGREAPCRTVPRTSSPASLDRVASAVGMAMLQLSHRGGETKIRLSGLDSSSRSFPFHSLYPEPAGNGQLTRDSCSVFTANEMMMMTCRAWTFGPVDRYGCSPALIVREILRSLAG
jgi:hypothetical protein